MYTIKNETGANRVIYDTRHQAISIPDGFTRENVDLHPRVAAELQQARKNGTRELEVTGSPSAFATEAAKADGSGGAEAVSTTESAGLKRNEEEGAGPKPIAADRSGTAQSKAALGAEGGERYARAQTLLHNADGADFNEWKRDAADVLGDDMPAGNPRKDAIVAKLKDVKED